MTDAEVYQGIYEIFENAFSSPCMLSPDTTTADVEGWDSNMTILLVLAAEDKFKIRLSSREVEAFESIKDLAGSVTDKLKSKDLAASNVESSSK